VIGRTEIAMLLFFLYLIFTIWVYSAGTENRNIPERMNEDAYAGKLLYQEYNCSSCHQLFGLGGYLGPELTNVISSKGKGEDYVKAFLKIGSRQMPDFQLDSLQSHQLVSFLAHIDSSAKNKINLNR